MTQFGRVLYAKPVVDKMKEEIKERVKGLRYTPTLAVVQVGDNPASNIYVNKKKQLAEELGIRCDVFKIEEETTTDELLQFVEYYNDIEFPLIIQLPLPAHIDKEKVLEAIYPSIDVDGFHFVNKGLLSQGKEDKALLPCTAKGIFTLLDYYGIEVEGKHMAVVGRSEIVGKPVAYMGLNRNATVSVIHSKTDDYDKQSIIADADIVVCAAGVPMMFNEYDFTTMTTIIDVGIHRDENGKIVGDFDHTIFNDMDREEINYTPWVGGIGLMTTISLMENVVIAWERLHGREDE